MADISPTAPRGPQPTTPQLDTQQQQQQQNSIEFFQNLPSQLAISKPLEKE